MSASGEVNEHTLLGPVVGKDSVDSVSYLIQGLHGFAKDLKISLCHCINVREKAVAYVAAFD